MTVSRKDDTPPGTSPDAPKPPARATRLRTLIAGVILVVIVVSVALIIIGGAA
jgi:hypothetical protein